MEGEQNNVNVGGVEEGGSMGPIIGGVVILAIIVLGGLYFWGQRTVTDVTPDQTVNTENVNDTASAIEADLNATDIENLDTELNVI